MFWNLVHYEFLKMLTSDLALYAAVLVLSAPSSEYRHKALKIYHQEKVRLLCYFLATVFGGLMLTLARFHPFSFINNVIGIVSDRLKAL